MKHEREIKRLLGKRSWNEDDIRLALALASFLALARERKRARALAARLAEAVMGTPVRLSRLEFHMLLDLILAGLSVLSDGIKDRFFPRPMDFIYACGYYEEKGRAAAPMAEALWRHSRGLPTRDRTEISQLRLRYAEAAFVAGDRSRARRLLAEEEMAADPSFRDVASRPQRLMAAGLHIRLGDTEKGRRIVNRAITACINEDDDAAAKELFRHIRACLAGHAEAVDPLLRRAAGCARDDRQRLDFVELLIEKGLARRVPGILAKMADRDLRETARMHLAVHCLANDRFVEAERERPKERFAVPADVEWHFFAGPLGEEKFYASEDRRRVILSWLDLLIGRKESWGNELSDQVREHACLARLRDGMIVEAEEVRAGMRGKLNLMESLIHSAAIARGGSRGLNEAAKDFLKRAEELQSGPTATRALRRRYVLGLFRLGEKHAGARVLRAHPDLMPVDTFEGRMIVDLLVKGGNIKKMREFKRLIREKDLRFKVGSMASKLYLQGKRRLAAELWIEGLLIAKEE